ncbi:MAG: hypothetical protein DMG60_22970, partial [Acidobacteria bacterium]
MIFALVILFATPLLSQQPSSANAPAEQQVTPGVAVDSARKTVDLPGYDSTGQNEGGTLGSYEVRQTWELGGRVANPSGNRGMWDSYVNLDSGPRLLEQSLDMHSANHTGFLFDDLTFANFGYGGDPNNVTRLQLQKGTLYNFQGNFRRDKNFFDYDLLANPLNPSTSNPNRPVLDSPHLFETTRRMSDLNLNLFDQAPVRIRFGYGHYINDGGAFSTVHQGTEGLLFQPTRNTSNNYQAGVSFRILPRTSLNYDQFYTHYKNDSSWQLAGLPFTLANGAAVDLGLPFNTVAAQPCATPIVAGGVANTGPAKSRRVNTTADFATTVHVTDRFRIVDTFRFSNFRIPGSWLLSENDLFGANLLSTPNTYNPATCPPPFTAAACPQHTASSGPDVIQSTINNFLGQDSKINTFELEYDFTKRISAHMGYRYQRRDINVRLSYVQVGTFYPNRNTRGGCTQVANNICSLTTVLADDNDFTEINGHSGLFGVSARPTNNFRISFDTELYSADNTFTRIVPRQFQDYRLRATYKPKDWINFGSAIVIREGRNNVSDVGHLDHNRSYGFTASVNPNEKFSLDVNYDYNDVFSRTNICFVTTPSPPVSISCGGSPFAAELSFYTETAHSGGGGLLFRPIPRVTTGIAYTITSSVGSTLILNPNAPTGPLSYNYHLPQATLAIDLNKHLTYKT